MAETIASLKVEVETLRGQIRDHELATRYIDTKFLNLATELRDQIRRNLKDDTTEHRVQVTTFYSKFEHFIYAIVVALLVFGGYVGYKVNDLPRWIGETAERADKQIQGAIETRTSTLEKTLNFKWTKATEGPLEQLSKAVESADVGARAVSDINDRVKHIRDEAVGLLAVVREAATKAEALERGTVARYAKALSSIERKARLFQINTAITRFENRAPETPREVAAVVDAVELSVGDGDVPSLEALLPVLHLISERRFAAVRARVADAIRIVVTNLPTALDNVSIVRAGVYAQETTVVDKVRERLKGSVATAEGRREIDRTLDVFLDPRRRPVRSLMGFLRRFRAVSAKPFYDELIKLAAKVEGPGIGRKAVKLLGVRDLSSNQRTELNGVMFKWAKASNVRSVLLVDLLTKLPLDQWTGQFYDMVFKDSAVSDGIKAEAAEHLVRALTNATETQFKTVIAVVGKEALGRWSPKRNILRLQFVRAKNNGKEVHCQV